VLLLAAIVTVIAIPLVIFRGVVGACIYAVFLVVCLIRASNQRLKNIGAEDFWNTRPKD
jgi:hypothetical protein